MRSLTLAFVLLVCTASCGDTNRTSPESPDTNPDRMVTDVGDEEVSVPDAGTTDVYDTLDADIGDRDVQDDATEDVTDTTSDPQEDTILDVEFDSTDIGIDDATTDADIEEAKDVDLVIRTCEDFEPTPFVVGGTDFVAACWTFQADGGAVEMKDLYLANNPSTDPADVPDRITDPMIEGLSLSFTDGMNITHADIERGEVHFGDLEILIPEGETISLSVLVATNRVDDEGETNRPVELALYGVVADTEDADRVPIDTSGGTVQPSDNISGLDGAIYGPRFQIVAAYPEILTENWVELPATNGIVELITFSMPARSGEIGWYQIRLRIDIECKAGGDTTEPMNRCLTDLRLWRGSRFSEYEIDIEYTISQEDSFPDDNISEYIVVITIDGSPVTVPADFTRWYSITAEAENFGVPGDVIVTWLEGETHHVNARGPDYLEDWLEEEAGYFVWSDYSGRPESTTVRQWFASDAITGVPSGFYGHFWYSSKSAEASTPFERWREMYPER